MDELSAKRHLASVIRWEGSVPDKDALKIAINAMEKRIPIKPYKRAKLEGFGNIYGCHCGALIETLYDFCPRCGQAIDWTEE